MMHKIQPMLVVCTSICAAMALDIDAVAAPAVAAASAPVDPPATASPLVKADPQAEQQPISVAGLLGDGFADAYKLGIGVRGGYTLLGSIYIGGQFLYHLGTTQETGSTKTTVKSFLFGVEGGYPVSTGPVIVRPYLGIGLIKVNATVSFSGLFPDQDAGFTKIYFVPGTAVLYPLGKSFVGADVRYTLVDTYSSFGFFLTGGSTF